VVSTTGGAVVVVSGFFNVTRFLEPTQVESVENLEWSFREKVSRVARVAENRVGRSNCRF